MLPEQAKFFSHGQKSDVRSVPEMQHGDYISLLLDPESDLDLTGKGTRKPLISGTIHPFHKSHSTVLGQFQEEFRLLLTRRNVRVAAFFIFINCLVIMCLSMWSSSTNSLALRSYNYITMFELLGLVTYILSSWSLLQNQRTKSNSHNTYTLGFERIEVLGVFSSVVIAQLGAVFIFKEAIERLIEQPEIHAGRLLPGALLAFLFHVTVNYCLVNHAFTSICEVASSSWMQEHVADMSKGICGIIPMLESILLPRVNPFFLVSFSTGCGVLLVDLLLQIDNYYLVDTLVGICIAVIIIGTMWPITVCSGRVLLHTTPPHVLGQLDKLLSEAQTLDGVLEIKSQKFYTLSLGLSGRRGGKPCLTLAGSLQVRVRRDADEQMVLAHVTNRLSSLVPLLTVQVMKDDYISSPAVAGISGKLPLKPSPPSQGFSQVTSHYISGFNKPAAAVAPYLQTPPRKPPPSYTARTSSDVKLASKNEQKDDFSFSSPLKTTPTAFTPMLKPRTSQTDIARMYRAAGLKHLASSSSPSFNLQGTSTFSSFQTGKPMNLSSSNMSALISTTKSELTPTSFSSLPKP
ncbi:zinc transporter 6-like [Styela clava]